MSDYQLYLDDCLEVLPTLKDKSVDAIITDLPYGTTACEWDVIIPLDAMWKQVKRVLKVNGVFITTSAQPFTSVLIVSNLSMFRYDITWDKVTPTGFLNCNNAPLRSHESIVIFYQQQPTYNPQMIKKPYKGSRTGAGFTQKGKSIKGGVYGSLVHGSGFRSDMSYPKSVWEFPTGNGQTKSHYEHPTQKPVALYEYLIRTYTNAGDTVLDFCMGSGTTIVAAIQTGRKSIGIEKEEKYFKIAKRRAQAANIPLFT